MSVNKVVLVGRLGNKPDGKYTPSGLSVCTFSIATNEIWMNAQKERQDHTEWHNIVTWNKTADFVSDNLDKGDLIYVEGKIRTRKYTTKDNIERRTTEIIATNLIALSSKNKTDRDEQAYSNQNSIGVESNKNNNSFEQDLKQPTSNNSDVDKLENSDSMKLNDGTEQNINTGSDSTSISEKNDSIEDNGKNEADEKLPF